MKKYKKLMTRKNKKTPSNIRNITDILKKTISSNKNQEKNHFISFYFCPHIFCYNSKVQ